MAEEGLRLIRVDGPADARTATIPIPRSKSARMLDAIAERGRDPYPRKVRFTTWTLAYNRMKWVTVDALGTALGARARGCRRSRAIPR